MCRDTPGIVLGKPMRDCTADEIHEKVWALILAHTDEEDAQELSKPQVLEWFFDPVIDDGFRGKLTVRSQNGLNGRAERHAAADRQS